MNAKLTSAYKFNLKQLDNFHILLWLIKDICWVKEFKVGGMIMVIPTITVAFIMAYKTKQLKTKFYSNFAIFCWMLADSTWMIDDFYSTNLSYLTVSFFLSGILAMLYYYVFISSLFTRIPVKT